MVLSQVFRKPAYVILGIMLVSLILALIQFNAFQVGAFYDDAHYVVLAEGVATGQGVHLINSPDKPVEPAFNVGWPILLSPVAILFPGNYDAMKVLSLVLWLACIPLTYLLFGPRLKA